MKRRPNSSPRGKMQRQDYSRPLMNTNEIPKDMLDNIRLNPEKRICPSYDYLSIAEYRVADRDKMGFRVIDDAVWEHIM
ncbi:MAG: hypothetical protein E7475_03490 [Ruminococcaceae bacterium]|nr:hypothetical protein [Oscillospiraceae bacterium]